MKYQERLLVIEAITFDELIEVGRLQGVPLYNGMPWSFTYQGHPVTHENDDCYIIITPAGQMKFLRSDMLITGITGQLSLCPADVFARMYEAVPAAALS